MPAIRRPLRERCNVQLSVVPPPPTTPVGDHPIERDLSLVQRTRPHKRNQRANREVGLPYARPQKDATKEGTTEPQLPDSEKIGANFVDTSVESFNEVAHEVEKQQDAEKVYATAVAEEDDRVPYDRPSCDPTKARVSVALESPRRAVIPLPGMHELVPFLHLAFSKGDYTPSSVATKSGHTFTHIIKMVQPTSSESAGTTSLEYDPDTTAYVLRLILCRPKARTRRTRSIRARDTPLLNEHQLLIARDFLALALPYYSENDVLEAGQQRGDVVHALITAPKEGGGAVDIMSVAACYLVHTSCEDIFTVLRYIEEEEEVPSEWKDVIGVCKDGTGLVSAVATMPL